PAWFLYEVTIANLTSMTDDRSTGLKRWFLVAAPVLTIAAIVPVFAVSPSERLVSVGSGISALLCFFSFCAYLFQGDPIGPSRRVTAAWDEVRASPFRRFLGPGVIRSAVLVLASGVGSLVIVAGASAFMMRTSLTQDRLSALVFFGYALGFFVFLVGFGAYLRSRTTTAMVSRVLLFTILFAIAAGPWIFAVIADLITDGTSHNAYAIAAPSPFYVFMMIDAIEHARGDLLVYVGLVAIAIWACLGLLFLLLAQRRCAKIIAAHEAMLAETDRILAAEDEAEIGAAAKRAAEPAAAVAEAQVVGDFAPPEAPAGGA
ncbi:MAG: ABC transporter permease, partial [Byssovorax sp.]